MTFFNFLVDFLVDFRSTFGRLLVDFWSTRDSILVDFWVDPGVDFGKFLAGFGEAGSRLLGGLGGGAPPVKAYNSSFGVAGTVTR